MSLTRVVVVSSDIVTPYGWGLDSCWKGLMSRKTAISRFDRFSTNSFQSSYAAVIPDLKKISNKSLVMQMLEPLFQKKSSFIPADALLILATTTGEIDFLEEHVLNGTSDYAYSRLDYLLKKVRNISGVKDAGIVISAACSSSSAAIAQAAEKIVNAEHDCVLVVACDCVSEFVYSGFSTINALDKDQSRPFDKNRSGLSLGEAAGYVLLMSAERAARENRPIVSEVSGWGLSNDANHITGPSRDGEGLRLAIDKALKKAGVTPEEVGCIAAHGTGTIYNDSMELKAFNTVFRKRVTPLYSIKGGTGHTLGSAGLIEMMVAIRTLKEKVVPATVNMVTADSEAEGWALSEPRSFDSPTTLSTNSGFGGINAALVLNR